jgi:tetratricopeptide (TPR) repeat protein
LYLIAHALNWSSLVLHRYAEAMQAKENADQIIALIASSDINAALLSLESAIKNLQGVGEWQVLGAIVPEIPDALSISSPRWAGAMAKLITCSGVGDANTFFERAMQQFTIAQAPLVWLEWAFELYLQHDNLAAESLLEQIIPHLHGVALATAWRRIGLARFHSGHLAWRDCFRHAQDLLEPTQAIRLLGQVLLDHATCAYTEGATIEARDLAFDALKLLKRDSVLHVRTCILLGVILTRLLDLEAASFLEDAVERSRRGDAAVWAATALQALAFVYRIQGDWQRSEYLLQAALKRSASDYEKSSVHYALGSLYRHMNQPNFARRELREVTHQYFQNAVSLEQAALELEDVRIEIAQGWLSQVQQPRGGDFEQALILQAEFARLNHDPAIMCQYLKQLNTTSRVAREEVHRFKDLFCAAKELDLDNPIPLLYISRRSVQVRVSHGVEVFINGKRVRSIAPHSRSGALLVELIRPHPHVSRMDTLIDSLYPTSQKRASRIAALKSVKDTLLGQLCWAGAITQLRTAYALDDQTDWQLIEI